MAKSKLAFKSLPLTGFSPLRRKKHTAFPQYKSLGFTKMILLLGGWKTRKAMCKCWDRGFTGGGFPPGVNLVLYRDFCEARATVRGMVREL